MRLIPLSVDTFFHSPVNGDVAADVCTVVTGARCCFGDKLVYDDIELEGAEQDY